jgi:intracellular multiplication protein IcmK
MKIINKKAMTLLACLGLASGSAFAAGFGVSGQNDAQQPAMNSAVAKLLNSSKDQAQPSNHFSRYAAAVKPAAVPTQTVSSNTNPNSVGNSAFSNTVQQMMPMSPEQIKTLRYMFDQSQHAAATYPGTAPRPTSSSVIVNLSPGATPPVIRLRAGYISSLDFLDSTGAAWPVAAYDLGDPKDFNVQWNRTGNTLLIQATSTYKPGNLAVMLKGHDTPVMLTLMPGQSNVDYRVDLRVPGMGPNAQADTSGLPSTENPQLINFLDGVPPNGANALVISGDNNQSQAWLYGNKIYLRTTTTVLSPGWISSMSSPDGTHVYELPKAPVILASLQGTMIQLTIKGL